MSRFLSNVDSKPDRKRQTVAGAAPGRIPPRITATGCADPMRYAAAPDALSRLTQIAKADACHVRGMIAGPPAGRLTGRLYWLELGGALAPSARPWPSPRLAADASESSVIFCGPITMHDNATTLSGGVT